MPKVKQNHDSKLKKYVSEFGENIFSTDGLILYCKICDVKVSSEKKFHIQQHIGRDKHKNAIAKIENSKEFSLSLIKIPLSQISITICVTRWLRQISL